MGMFILLYWWLTSLKPAYATDEKATSVSEICYTGCDLTSGETFRINRSTAATPSNWAIIFRYSVQEIINKGKLLLLKWMLKMTAASGLERWLASLILSFHCCIAVSVTIHCSYQICYYPTHFWLWLLSLGDFVLNLFNTKFKCIVTVNHISICIYKEELFVSWLWTSVLDPVESRTVLTVDTALPLRKDLQAMFFGWGWLCLFAGPTMGYQMNLCCVAMESHRYNPRVQQWITRRLPGFQASIAPVQTKPENLFWTVKPFICWNV